MRMPDLISRLQILDAQLRAFLEALYVDQPGHFRPCLRGLTELGLAARLVPSCLALQTWHTLNLWDELAKDDREAWVRFIQSFQGRERRGRERVFQAAFIDPPVLERLRSQERLGARLRRALPFSGPLSEIERLPLGTTRRAVAALTLVEAYPLEPYRALHDSPRAVQRQLDRIDWSDPARAAAATAELVVLACTQTPHFLELTEIRQLKSRCVSYIERVTDSESGAYFRAGAAPAPPTLLRASSDILNALDWLDTPPQRPERLIDTCLAHPPARQDGTFVAWVHVVYRCTQFTSHRLGEIQDLAPTIAEGILEHQQRDGGLSFEADRGLRFDGMLELADGRPQGDLYATSKLIEALAMLGRLCEWDGPRWMIGRH